MLPILASLLIECYISLTYANPLGPSGGRTIALTPTFPDPLSPSSLSASSNVSASRIVVQCDDEYGVNLDLADCRNALALINPSKDRVVFADRDDPGRSEGWLPLPFRLMGSKSIVSTVLGEHISDIEARVSALLHSAGGDFTRPHW